MKLNVSALCLALASGVTSLKHEIVADAKSQPVQFTGYHAVLKGVLPIQENPVFVDMDDDKKTGNSDDKKDKDDDDDKKNKDDDDDKKSRNSSVPDCKTNGVNYNKCNPATMKPSDTATCNSIEKDVCGSNMSSSDKDYCQCLGFKGHVVVISAGFPPVLKGAGHLKHKQVFVDLETDDGGKTDDGNKNTDDGKKNTDDGNKNTDDKKTDDNGTDDKKTDDNGTDDKKTDDGIIDDKTNDDKKNKDDDDDKKNKDDDDDDKKNKDDDDDDKSRGSNLPECITDGKNYLRCDPSTMNPSDAATCNSIKNEVCGNDMSNVDVSYCACLGFTKPMVTSHGFRPMRKGAAPLKDTQVFVYLDKDDDGGKNGGGNDDKKSAGNNDDKKNVNTNDDKKNISDDKKGSNDDDKKRKNDDDDDKKNKDDDDDKKNKDDDDDDKKNRNNSVPECISGGKNYLRCEPSKMNPSDAATCNSIKKEVCGSNMSNSDVSYCQCIGLDGKSTAQLRGAVSAMF